MVNENNLKSKSVPKTLPISHILVTYDYEAEDILRLLKQGKHFADLARKFSICSSAKDGGDLSMIPIKKLDPHFLDQVIYLKPDTISKPFKTRFGVHIVYRHMLNV